MAEDVELAKAQQQIEAARANVEQQRENAARAESQLKTQQEKLQSQQVLRAAGIQGTAQRQTAAQQIKSAGENISEFKKQLSQYESDVIKPAESQLADIKTQIQYQKDYEFGVRLRQSDNPYLNVNALPAGVAAGYTDTKESEESIAQLNAKVSAALEKLNAGVSEAEAFKGLPSMKVLEQSGMFKFTKTNQDGTVDRNPIQTIEMPKIDVNMGKIPSTPSFSTGIGMVSASDLNTKGTITGYGLGNSSGTLTGMAVSSGSQQLANNSSGSWWNRLTSTFKSDVSGNQKTFIPNVGGAGAYGEVSSTGEKGTLILTNPTPVQWQSIEKAQISGSLTPQLNPWLANVRIQDKPVWAIVEGVKTFAPQRVDGALLPKEGYYEDVSKVGYSSSGQLTFNPVAKPSGEKAQSIYDTLMFAKVRDYPDDTKGFYQKQIGDLAAQKSTIMNAPSPSQNVIFSESLPVDKSNLVTSFYGGVTGLKEYAIKKINPPQVRAVWNLDTNEASLGTAPNSFLQSAGAGVINSLVPETPLQTVGLLATAYGVNWIAKAAPTTFGLVSSGFGLKGLSDYSQAFTSGEKESAAASTVFGFAPIGIKVLGKTSSKIFPKIAIRTLDIPQEEGSIAIKTLGLETSGGRAFILGGKTPEGFNVGTPKVLEYLKKMPDTTEIKLGSASETKVLFKNLQDAEGITPRAKDLIPIGQSILRPTQNLKSAFINEDFLTSATERLPKEGVNIFLDIGKENKAVLFGSKSRAFQLAQEYNINGDIFKLNKVPRDIELRFDAGSGKITEATQTAITRLKKLGVVKKDGKTFDFSTTREIKDTPNAIEVKIDGKWEKVYEGKGNDGIIEKEEVPEWVLGIKKVGKPIETKFGILATPLNEELRGVAQGVFRLRKEKGTGLLDIYPSPKRTKDIGSVSVAARTLDMSKPTFNLFQRFRQRNLGTNIEKFESYFPEALVREQVIKVLKNPEKGIIADFRELENPLSPSLSIKASQSTALFSKTYPVLASEIKSESPKTNISPSILSKSQSPKSVSVSPSPYSPSSISPFVSSPSPSLSISPYPSVGVFSSSPKSESPSKSISPSSSVSPSPYSPRSPPSPPTENKPSSLSSKVKSLMKKINLKKSYNVYTRRKGKEILIGKGLPFGKATKLGADIAKGTLAASFKLKESNIPTLETDINYNLGKEFAPSKREAGRIVQIAKYRLGSFGERKEIKMFQKSKIKKGRFF